MWIRVLRPRAVAVDNTAASVGGIELSSLCLHGLEGLGYKVTEQRVNNAGWGPIADTRPIVIATREDTLPQRRVNTQAPDQ